MISLQLVVMKRRYAAPQEQAEDAVELFTPALNNFFAMEIKPPRPIEHGEFVVVRFFLDLNNVETVVEAFLDYILQAHATMGALPDVTSRELGERVFFLARRSIKVDQSTWLQAFPCPLKEPSIFRHVLNHTIGHNGIKRFSWLVGKKIFQNDGGIQFFALDQFLYVVERVLEQRHACDPHAARTEVFKRSTPSCADIQQAHARTQFQRLKSFFQLALGCLLQKFIVVIEQTVRVEPRIGIKKVKVEIIAKRVVAIDDFFVRARDGSKKQVAKKMQPRNQAHPLGKLLAHVKNGQHIAVKIKIAVDVSLAQGQFINGMTQQLIAMHGDAKTRNAFTGGNNPPIGQFDFTRDIQFLKEPLKPAWRSRRRGHGMQCCFWFGLRP